MSVEVTVSSPFRRSQSQNARAFSSILDKKYSKSDDTDSSCSVLIRRHRFLLTALALLAILCTVYLYFAVTFGMRESCSELTGAEKAQCSLKLTKMKLNLH